MHVNVGRMITPFHWQSKDFTGENVMICPFLHNQPVNLPLGSNDIRRPIYTSGSFYMEIHTSFLLLIHRLKQSYNFKWVHDQSMLEQYSHIPFIQAPCNHKNYFWSLLFSVCSLWPRRQMNSMQIQMAVSRKLLIINMRLNDWLFFRKVCKGSCTCTAWYSSCLLRITSYYRRTKMSRALCKATLQSWSL